jgi:hypothetical protein
VTAATEKLEARVERLRRELDTARATARAHRTARGPWVTTNRKNNQRLQNRLNRQISEVSMELFRAKMAERKAAV